MNSLSPVAKTFRTFGGFVLLGFLTLVLAPPLLGLLTAIVSLAIALTSAFLPFAIVGLLVWVPYQLLTKGPHNTWQRTREMVHGFKETALGAPLRLCGGIWSRTCAVGQAAANFNRNAFRFVGFFLLEALSGALVGLLVAVLTGVQPLQGEHLALCIGLGAAVGGLLSFTRLKSAEVAAPPEEGNGLTHNHA